MTKNNKTESNPELIYSIKCLLEDMKKSIARIEKIVVKDFSIKQCIPEDRL